MRELPPDRNSLPDMDITDDDLLGCHFTYDDPTNQEEQIVDFLVRGVNQNAIAATWSERTKYPENSKFGPQIKYEHKEGDPAGQCGVTAMALAMAMVWRGIATPDKIFYEEGKLRNAKGDLLGDHHVWLRIEGENGQEWRVDVASRQYSNATSHPDEHINIVLQGVHHMVGHYYGINRRYDTTKFDQILSDIPVPNALSLQYEVDEIDGKKSSTPISEYDAALLEGRLERFIYKYEQSVYLRNDLGRTARFGNAVLGLYQKSWYPRNYDRTQETWGPNEIFNLDFEQESILELVKDLSHETLALWAHDCAVHVQPFFEKAQPEDTSLRDASKALLKWIGLGHAYEKDISNVALNCGQALERLQPFHPVAKLAAESMISAVLSAGHPEHAIDATRNALRAVYYADKSDSLSGNRTAFLNELKWQEARLMQVKERVRRWYAPKK